MTNRTKLMALCAAASPLALPLASQAQQTPNAAAPAAQTEAQKTRTFALRHVAKAQMLQWLEAGTIHLPTDVSELHAVEAGNALTASGSSDSLNQLGKVIGQLDQPLQLIQCSVQAFLVQPAEVERIMTLGDGEKPPEGVSRATFYAIQQQRRLKALASSPGVYTMSGAGTWISGVPAMLRLSKTPTSPAMDLMIGLQVENDGLHTLAISGPFPNDGESFISRTSNRFDGKSYGLFTSSLGGKIGTLLERDGAPRNAEMVVISTPRIVKTAAETE